MAKAKLQDLRSLSAGELDLKRAELAKELLDLRQKRLVGQLDKPHLFRQVKRQIARILTIRREAQNV